MYINTLRPRITPENITNKTNQNKPTTSKPINDSTQPYGTYQPIIINYTPSTLYDHISPKNPIWQILDLEKETARSSPEEQSVFLETLNDYINKAQELITPQQSPEEKITILYTLLISGGNTTYIKEKNELVKLFQEINPLIADTLPSEISTLSPSQLFMALLKEELPQYMAYQETNKLISSFVQKKYDCDTLSMMIGLMCFELNIPIQIISCFPLELESTTGHAFIRCYTDNTHYFNFESTSGSICPDSNYDCFFLHAPTQKDLANMLLVNYIDMLSEQAPDYEPLKVPLNKAIELDPTHPFILSRIIRLYMQNKDYANAKKLLMPLQEQQNPLPEKLAFLDNILDIYLNNAPLSKQTQQYFENLLQRITKQPASPENNSTLDYTTATLFNNHCYAEAIPWFNLCLERNIDRENNTLYLLESLIKENNLDSAQKLIDQEKTKYPNNISLLKIGAQLALQKNDYAQAVTYYELIQKIMPYEQETSPVLASCLFFLDRIPEAITLLESVINTHPNHARAQELLTQFRACLGIVSP